MSGERLVIAEEYLKLVLRLPVRGTPTLGAALQFAPRPTPSGSRSDNPAGRRAVRDREPRYDLGGLKGLWRALAHPEEDVHPDRILLADAANLLQIGEFQLLQLAGRQWLGRDLTPEEIDRWFRRLVYRDEVPQWARVYAREILRLDRDGKLNPDRVEYHHYDSRGGRQLQASGRNFLLIAAGTVGLMLVLLLVATRMVTNPVSMLPPFMDQDDDRPAAERPVDE